MLGYETRTLRDEKILEHISSQPDAISGILTLVAPGQIINEPIPIFRKCKHILCFMNHTNIFKKIKKWKTMKLKISDFNSLVVRSSEQDASFKMIKYFK